MNDALAFRLALAVEVGENPIKLDPKMYGLLMDYFQSMGYDTCTLGPGFGPSFSWMSVPVVLD